MNEPSVNGDFLWLTGIEDTFITAPDPGTGRTLDEYELTQHYAAWRADLALVRELGVRAMRYGIPWHRINPAPGVWDFSWADGPLEHLLELGIHPVVDLVHYGVPLWLEGAFLNPDYDRRVAEYAARVAERYRGRIRYYTPLNEPRVTAWYTGKLGLWPPFRRGSRGYVEVMMALCRGIVRTERALREVDPEIVSVHVDATDLYSESEPALAGEARHRQEVVFLALDLVSGRVDADHTLYPWLRTLGVSESALAWFLENSASPDVVGINLYPMFSQKVIRRRLGRLRMRMPYASASIVERLAELYYARYRKPLWISETASNGSVERRRAWLDDSVNAVARARGRGIPLVGYTWWPLFALVRWAYRQGRRPAGEYLEQMGLWDLVAGSNGELRRVRTPLVERYRELVASGATLVGSLGPRATESANRGTG